jgi:hypothetical protein
MRQRLGKSAALKLLRECLRTGIVEYHPHFDRRCRERGIHPQDAQYWSGLSPSSMNPRFSRN